MFAGSCLKLTVILFGISSAAKTSTVFLREEETITISSPGYPEPYPPNYNEMWTFNSPNGFILNFSSFSMEEYSDSIFFKNGESNMSITFAAVITGNIDTDKIYVLPGSFLSLEFSTDAYDEDHAGFLAEIKAVDPRFIPHCGGFLLLEEEICNNEVSCSDERDENECPPLKASDVPISIFSPNYPMDYLPNSSFLWKFKVEDGAYLKIEFIDFHTEYDYDVLIVWADLYADGVIIPIEEHFSGYTGHQILYLNGITYLHFASDEYSENSGFHLEISALNVSRALPQSKLYFYEDESGFRHPTPYSTNCDAMLGLNNCYIYLHPSETTLLATPGYPSLSLKSSFFWNIVTANDSHITLSLEAAWLIEDYLLIGSGHFRNERNPIIKVNGLQNFIQVVSPENTLWIQYEAYQRAPEIGFIAHISSSPDHNMSTCDEASEEFILSTEESLLGVKSNVCLWTAVYRNPSTVEDYYIQFDLLYLAGVDGPENYFAVGEGSDPGNSSSLIFNQSNIHYKVDFFLERLNVRAPAIWIQIRSLRIPVEISLNTSLRDYNVFCKDDQYECEDRHCINAQGVKSGLKDCPDGSDEHPRFGFRDCIHPEHSYTNINRTTEVDCLEWNSSDLLRTRGLPGNFCRTLGNLTQRPGCLMKSVSNDEEFIWRTCIHSHCYERSGCYSDDGKSYGDIGMFTANGFRCLRWSEIPKSYFNESSGTTINTNALSENFCRNVGNKTMPWCFYVDVNNKIQWEYCAIFKCSSHNLQKFRRYPKTYFLDRSDRFGSNAILYQTVFTEEDCTTVCLEHFQEDCMSFIYPSGESPYYHPVCYWSVLSPNTNNGLGNLTYDNDWDLFVRIQTECNPFSIETLPEKCSLPVTLSNDFVTTNINETSNLYNAFKYSTFGLNSCWRPGNQSEPLQLWLGERYIISALLVSGCGAEDHSWVTEISVTSDVFHYQHVDAETNSHTLKANIEPICSVMIPINPRIRSHFLSVTPVSYHMNVAMKIDILACRDDDCDEDLGILDGTLPDTSLSSSSAKNSNHLPSQVRFQPFGIHRYETFGWMPSIQDASPWVQISFSVLKVVRAILVQGCQETGSWVKSFYIAYSVVEDSVTETDFAWVQLKNVSQEKHHLVTFLGNSDSISPLRIYLKEEIKARHVRIYPTGWELEPCIKVALVGCSYQACFKRLGMESGEIRNSQLTQPGFCQQSEGFRLFHFGPVSFSAVDPSIHTKSQTVGIDLIHQHIITAIATQGVPQGFFATYFKLKYERQHASNTWNTYLNIDGSEKVFEANFDHITVVINHLDRPIVTSKIRLEYGYIDEQGPDKTCIRMEVFGCNYEESGNVCGSHGKEILGRCFGVVEGNTPSACPDIFQENSYPAIVNSENLQTTIYESFQELQLPNYLFYRIGMTSVWVQEYVEQRLIWGDGTPVIYENFFDRNILLEGGNATYCAFMVVGNFLQWQILECNTVEINAATLCQFDLNECLEWHNQCSDECIDLPGSYICKCPSGMHLDVTSKASCISSCKLRGSDDIVNDDNLCLSSNPAGESWNDAMEICSHQNASLLSIPSSSSVYPELIPKNSSTQGIWIANDPNSTVNNGSAEGLCPSYTEANLIIQSECHLKLPFYCGKDIPETFELQSACEHDEYENTNTCLIEVVYYDEAYLTWYGLPPWYQQETTLRFHLVVAQHLMIRLTFVYVNLRQLTPSQCTDSVKIVQNFASAQSTRGTYCGILQNFDVQLDSHNATITLDIGKLSADMPKALEMHAFFRGLNCSIENCGTMCPTQPFTYPQGFIETHNYPALLPQFYSCVWHIIVNSGSAIRLEMIAIDIPCEPTFPLVLYVFQENSVGTISQQSEICGSDAGMIVSEGNHVALSLSTGLQQVSSGFQAKYIEQETPGCGLSHSSKEGCSHSTCTAPTAFIASKNYPLPYESNLDCSWTIKTSEGTYIEVNFTVFNVTSSTEDCQEDFLQLQFGSSFTKLCNPNIDRYGRIFKSDKNELIIRLKTNLDNLAGSFLALYQKRQSPFVSSNKTSVCKYQWRDINNKCFRLFRNHSNLHWLEAAEICKSFGNTTFLAAISDQFEMNAIHHYLLEEGDPTQGVFIGLRLREDKERHIWESGYPVSFTDWRVAGDYAKRQPDGGELERCSVIQFWSYRETSNWNDIPCAALVTNQFLCQDHQDVSVKANKSRQPLKFNEAINQNCTGSQHRCLSGECIQSVHVCDKTPDCSDHSDELDCEEGNPCLESQFMCNDGSCIPSSFYCDFIPNCFDRSDENQCVYPVCTNEEFGCKDGLCLPQSKVCDLVEDCFDGTDEENCASSTGYFQCFSGRILPAERLCDAYRDCSGKNWEDEPEDCNYLQSSFQCNFTSQLRCKSGACAELTYRCILEYDIHGYSTGCRDASHLSDCGEADCPETYFKCPGSYCIPEGYRCNGELDCPGGDDENDCESYRCAAGSYKCHGVNNQVCVPQDQVCDGIRNCKEGDDELYCDVVCFSDCSCIGMQMVCSRMNWLPEMASQLPTSLKHLSLTDLSTPTRQRRGVEKSYTEENSITKSLFINLRELKVLFYLDLSQNSIGSIEDGEFSNNLNLQYLILERNEIQSLTRKSFIGLNNLRFLSLAGNPLTQIEEMPFEPLFMLETLNIQSTLTTTVEDDFFHGIDNLKRLFSDKFFYCCLISQKYELDECFPEAGQFSSCEDLMKNRFLRINLWILGIAAVVGNGFVIFLRVYRKEFVPKMGRNPTQSILITNLAIADLCIGVYMLIIAVADARYRNVYYRYSEIWQTGSFCRFSGFLAVLGSEASVMFLTVITVDRFQGVTFPLSSRKLRFKSTCFVTGFVWSVALVFSAVPLIPFPYFGVGYYGKSSVCLALPLTRDYAPGWLYSVLLFLTFNFICFLVMLVCYVIIYVKAKRSVGSKPGIKKNRKGTFLEEQIQMAAKMSFLVITDMVCWMPVIIMGILSQSGAVDIPGSVYAWTAVLILPVNSALNPYLYTILVKAAKKAKEGSIVSKSDGSHMQSSASRPLYAAPLSVTKAPNSDLLQNVINGFRRNRLITVMSAASMQTYSLENLMSNDLFSLSETSRIDIEADVKKGVHYLHERGIIHGNISVSNIIIDGDDENNRRAFLVYPVTSDRCVTVNIHQDQNSLELQKKKDLNDVDEIVTILEKNNYMMKSNL